MTSEQLLNVLLELSQASKQIKNERDLRSTMDKYDMIFSGKNFNTINSIELKHSLLKCFHLEVSIEELNSFLPAVCPLLDMALLPMADITDLNVPIPAAYQITLW